jgi:ribulose-5-phosphate 4-epimerase/fuculose-1-phosphate aldolase
MPNPLAEACYELALANRIIAHEGVLDGFGHVSMRHPTDPGRYLLARSRSPELIEPADIFEFTLDSEPVAAKGVTLYGERVIHGCIYQARPDVNAVCHHHSPSVLPFCITGIELVPVFHMGAVLGTRRHSGTVETNSATPTCWWSSRRKQSGKGARRALDDSVRRHGALGRYHAARTRVPDDLLARQCRNQLLDAARQIGPLSRGEPNAPPAPIATTSHGAGLGILDHASRRVGDAEIAPRGAQTQRPSWHGQVHRGQTARRGTKTWCAKR